MKQMTPSALNQMIEKIIEVGYLTREDQLELNKIAHESPASPDDFKAVAKCMELLKQGQIRVAS